nr:MAG TPA: hypothetical protein [Caudoviricetes sp.]
MLFCFSVYNILHIEYIVNNFLFSLCIFLLTIVFLCAIVIFERKVIQ